MKVVWSDASKVHGDSNDPVRDGLQLKVCQRGSATSDVSGMMMKGLHSKACCGCANEVQKELP